MKDVQLSYQCPRHSRPVKRIRRSKNWVFVDMCEVELLPELVSVAESLQYPPVWPQRDSGKACLRGESSEGIVWTILPCQGSASLMQVRRFQSAQLLCLDSLCSSSSMRKEYIQDLLGDTGWWKGRLCHDLQKAFSVLEDLILLDNLMCLDIIQI